MEQSVPFSRRLHRYHGFVCFGLFDVTHLHKLSIIAIFVISSMQKTLTVVRFFIAHILRLIQQSVNNIIMNDVIYYSSVFRACNIHCSGFIDLG